MYLALYLLLYVYNIFRVIRILFANIELKKITNHNNSKSVSILTIVCIVKNISEKVDSNNYVVHRWVNRNRKTNIFMYIIGLSLKHFNLFYYCLFIDN